MELPRPDSRLQSSLQFSLNRNFLWTFWTSSTWQIPRNIGNDETMTSEADLRVSNLFDFSKHVVLITGGASGLGEMAAQAFVQNGARVIIASRKESELKQVRRVTPFIVSWANISLQWQCTDRLNKLGPGKCEYIVADLKDKKGCDQLTMEVKSRTAFLTVLLNNSGATWLIPFQRLRFRRECLSNLV